MAKINYSSDEEGGAPIASTPLKPREKGPLTPTGAPAVDMPARPQSTNVTTTARGLSAPVSNNADRGPPSHLEASDLERVGMEQPQHSAFDLPHHGACRSITKSLLRPVDHSGVPQITLTTPDTGNNPALGIAIFRSGSVRDEEGNIRSGLMLPPKLRKVGKRTAMKDTRAAFFLDESPMSLAKMETPKSPLEARSPRAVGKVEMRTTYEGLLALDEDMDVPEMFLCPEQEQEAEAKKDENLKEQEEDEQEEKSQIGDAEHLHGEEEDSEIAQTDERGRTSTRISSRRDKRTEDNEASDSWKRRGRSRTGKRVEGRSQRQQYAAPEKKQETKKVARAGWIEAQGAVSDK